MSQPKELIQYPSGIGELTGVPLDLTDALFAPTVPDPFGLRRRALTEGGLKLSLELARMAYTLELEPWMRAGWTDFSVQVDNQLTKRHKGSGLGLAISRSLVEMHGGKFEIKSTESEGTTVIFQLPLKPILTQAARNST
ncbi:MAG: hypothetical protein IH607_05780 [Firmicutes bacterium]|nr:hypothetical protein [Bacillota bacterium]